MAEFTSLGDEDDDDQEEAATESRQDEGGGQSGSSEEDEEQQPSAAKRKPGIIADLPKSATEPIKVDEKDSGKVKKRVADFHAKFDGRKDELCLPSTDLIRWWLKGVGRVTEDDIGEKARQVLEQTILPFCNHYWKLINGAGTEIAYKAVVVSDKGSRTARKWSYKPRFQWVSLKLSEFRSGHMPTFRVSNKTIADQWSRWHGAESYPGIDRLSPNARVQPHPAVLNTWTGTPIRPEHCVDADASDESDGANGERFVYALCSTEGKEVGLHFWRWLSICWVYAGYRSNLCCGLFGSGGSGKSLVALWLLYLFGRSLFVCIPSAASVFTNFNGQLRDKVMVWFDELHLKDADMNDRFKELITAEEVEINDKNMKVMHQTNCMNFGASSNKHSIIAPDHDGTRKFLLIKCFRTGCLMPEWSTPEAIHRLVNTDMYSLGARMMKTVAELPVGFDISKNVPMTQGMATVKDIVDGRDSVKTWWQACIEGEDDFQLLNDQGWGKWVPISALLKSYVEFYKDSKGKGGEGISSSKTLMSRFEVFAGPRGRERKTKASLGALSFLSSSGAKQVQCCLLPTRAQAAEAMGIDITEDPFAKEVAAEMADQQKEQSFGEVLQRTGAVKLAKPAPVGSASGKEETPEAE